MPRDFLSSERPLRVAVIGSGISGLSAAWLLSGAHDVALYEADDRLGGHSNTVDVPGPDGPIAVDTGFIVYNEANYPNLTALFRHLGVATQASDMSFAVSLDGGATEYSGGSLSALLAQKRNAVRPRFWRMVRDIFRFYREGPALLEEPGGESLSLGAWLDREGYSAAFIEDHLMPMAAAIWSTPVGRMRDHPASAFVRFCRNHGLMQVNGRPAWRTVAGGSREYVRRLAAALAGRIRLATPVRSIRRHADGVLIEDRRGGAVLFDHVVLATHADQALALLSQPSADERRLLGAFSYSRNEAVLHSDIRWMPRRRRAWASWNYLARRGGGGPPELCVTYWMNRLQALDPRRPLFVTLNPWQMPDRDKVYEVIRYDHPTYDDAALQAQRQLAAIQGTDRIWFCGSYFGAGFHEDGLAAGLAVAEAIGGVRRPWHEPAGSEAAGTPIALAGRGSRAA